MRMRMHGIMRGTPSHYTRATPRTQYGDADEGLCYFSLSRSPAVSKAYAEAGALLASFARSSPRARSSVFVGQIVAKSLWCYRAIVLSCYGAMVLWCTETRCCSACRTDAVVHVRVGQMP